MDSGTAVRNTFVVVAVLAAVRLVFNIVAQDSLVDEWVERNYQSIPEVVARDWAPDYVFLGGISFILGALIFGGAMLFQRGVRWAKWVAIGGCALLMVLNVAFAIQPAPIASKILGVVTAVIAAAAIVRAFMPTAAPSELQP